MEQFHFRTDDPELILSIKHEMGRAKLSRSGAVQKLVRAGLEHARLLREQEAITVHKSAQELSREEGEE